MPQQYLGQYFRMSWWAGVFVCHARFSSTSEALSSVTLQDVLVHYEIWEYHQSICKAHVQNLMVCWAGACELESDAKSPQWLS